jgi:hypothetical protein
MHVPPMIGRRSGVPGAQDLALLAGLVTFVLLGPLLWADPTQAARIPIGEKVVTASGETIPLALPRSQPAPATLRTGFTSRNLYQHETPELSEFTLEISRNVKIQTTGLPSCALERLFSSYASPLQTCRGSLVGHGRVTSEVFHDGMEFTVEGRLLAFYDLAEGQPRILAQVRSEGALPLTYVIPFEKGHGKFGTGLVVRKMNQILGICIGAGCYGGYTLQGVYGHISSFELFLHRLFTHHGKRESFVGADCPAGRGMHAASYPLEKLSLNYQEGSQVIGMATGKCKVSD